MGKKKGKEIEKRNRKLKESEEERNRKLKESEEERNRELKESEEINRKLKESEEGGTSGHIQNTSASSRDGDGLYEGLDWLSNNIASKDFCAVEIRTDGAGAAQLVSPEGVTESQAEHATTLMECGNLYMKAAQELFLSSANLMPSPENFQSEYEKVKEKYNQAKKCYDRALIVNPGLYKVLWALGELHVMMAKFHLDFVIQQNIGFASWDSEEALELFDSAAENMEKWKKDAGNGEVSAEQMEFWGLMLFERSQVECISGVKGWEENLDSAVKNLKLAGVSEPDISILHKNHYRWNLKSEATSKTVGDSEFVAKIKEDEVKRRIQAESLPTDNRFDPFTASTHDDM